MKNQHDSTELSYFRNTMLTSFKAPHFIPLTEVDSTNNYIANLVRTNQLSQTTIVMADYQHDGRGQRATKWQSPKAQNALFSIYVPWKNLNISEQFVVSMIIAVSICEILQKELSPKVFIKWPNDIYVNQQKIGGILIESDLIGSKVNSSILGIGLNINQMLFDPSLNATSLKLETGQNHDRAGIVQKITTQFLKKCEALENKADIFSEIKKEYLPLLYSLDNFTTVTFSRTGETIKIKPLDISRDGLLLAVDENNTLHTFEIKEISWQIK